MKSNQAWEAEDEVEWGALETQNMTEGEKRGLGARWKAIESKNRGVIVSDQRCVANVDGEVLLPHNGSDRRRGDCSWHGRKV